MFRTSLWTTAPTGSPYKALPTQHFLDVPLEES